MDPQKLDAFLCRIIETSPDAPRAKLALEQLREILSLQLTPEENARFSAAVAGVSDSLPAMQEAVKEAAPAGERFQIAAERAKQRRIREEQAADRGRC